MNLATFYPNAPALGKLRTVLLGLVCCTCVMAQPCEPGWEDLGMGEPQLRPWATVVFDDGQGLALYMGTGSQRDDVGSVVCLRDGVATPLGDPFDDPVHALGVFDDGTGPSLYAGGEFTTVGGVEASKIARWDGVRWAPVGSGVTNEFPWASVDSLASIDIGNGTVLYVGGSFDSAGGQPASGIAQWDGASWTALGGGLGSDLPGTGYANDMVVFNDGTGPSLFVVGSFDSAGGVRASDIARWDGQSWSSVGGGLDGQDVAHAHAISIFDDGGGPALYIGGKFAIAGGVPVNNIAKWDGTRWHDVGGGVRNITSSVPRIYDLQVHNGQLIVGGYFETAGEMPALNVARWDGSAWADMGEDLHEDVSTLCVLGDGMGQELYAGSGLLRLRKWTGSYWDHLTGGVDRQVLAMSVFNDGRGPALYVGGMFGNAGRHRVNHIARWDGTEWSPLGEGVEVFRRDTRIRAITPANIDGSELLYCAGRFDVVGGIQASSIAAWNGETWSALSGGLWYGDQKGRVDALEMFDSGSGPGLIASGYFDRAGNVKARGIARWDGSAWSSIGDFRGDGPQGPFSLAAFDDGSGPTLFAAGRFREVDGIPARGFARWDGTQWSVPSTSMRDYLNVLTVFDDGTGPSLYAAGRFRSPDGEVGDGVARWTGQDWEVLDTFFYNSSVGGVWITSLAPFSGSSGRWLVVGGKFSRAGSTQASGIARWDGQSWHPLADGLILNGAPNVFALREFDDGSGPALFVGGDFESAGGISTDNFAKWSECIQCPADFNEDGIVNTLDLIAFLNAFSAGDPRADFNGDGRVNTLDFIDFLNAYNEGC